MSRGKVDAVVANWFPRFLANGLDYLDVQRTLANVEDWDDWAPAWTAAADRYAELGERAEASGHRVTAAEHLRRAALTLQFAQFVLTEDPQRRRQLQQRQVDLYARSAPLLDPPAERVVLADGVVVGYLRVPAGVRRPGLVVLVPGLESTKEQFSTYEPFFLRRGLATLAIEGPGQGEAGWRAPFRTAAYEEAVGRVVAFVATRDDVDGSRVVVVGTSFGGYLALRYGDLFPGVRGIVDIAGPFDLSGFDDLQPVTQDSFREFAGAVDTAETKQVLADVTLEQTLPALDVDVLILHGERDTIIPVSNAHRIAAALGDRPTVHIEPHGNHSCQNLHTVVRPMVADWVCDRLAAAPARTTQGDRDD